MNSRIFRGTTTHARYSPVRHDFRYRLYWFGIDLDELELLDRTIRGFGYNRRSLASIRDREYGGPGGGTIRDRIKGLLGARQIDGTGLRITLMTIPRIAGYVFNPVNFYLCQDAEGAMQALVAEVRNTFGEVHHYVSQPESGGGPGDPSLYRFPKRFYVSPFLEMDGEYKVRVHAEPDAFRAVITLVQKGEAVFSASMAGHGSPIKPMSVLSVLLRMPLAAVTIMMKIQWQAVLLRVRRGLRPSPKPEPRDPGTIPSPQTSTWYWIRDRLLRYASKPTDRPSEGRKSEDEHLP